MDNFQDVNPEIFVLVAELVGNALAGKMPFNIQNAIGNWLQLAAQAIMTFNAQQQYFENGPGNCYDPRCKNVSNPCASPSPDKEIKKELDELRAEIEKLKTIIENRG